jgi:hypothetical protein
MPSIRQPRIAAVTLATLAFTAAACTSILGNDFTVADSEGGGTTTPAATTSTGGSGGSGGDVGSGAAGGGPGCGNGTIEAPEECDDGTDNGPGQACLDGCVANVCGDGDQGPSEGCDEGANNDFALGACAPDCSRLIEVKFIKFSATGAASGNFGPMKVAAADSHCEAGYKAMFAFGNVRRATTIPLQSSGAVDWVVRPYTYYYNVNNEPVFLTDDVPLIGVRGGQYVGIETAVAFVTGPVITNVSTNYLTLQTRNCQNWSSATSGLLTYGVPFELDDGFIDSDAFGIDCNTQFFFYCVEQ